MSNLPQKNKPEEIYFYGTCLIDLLYPEAGLAGMELIRREGVRVIFPNDQTCCGQPAWNSGYRDEARKVAAAQLRCFAKPYPVVVPSGSCAAMIKHHYPALFKDTADYEAAVELSKRVYELTEFLVRVLDIKLVDLGEPTQVALHTSCSARREMGVAGEHEALLEQLDNVQVLQQSHKKECCGFGGTFAIKHGEISTAMVREKAAAITATGATTLVSGDCGCLMNISGHLAHQEQELQSQHIANFIWERTHHAE